MWPDRRIIDLLGIEYPILLAPMGGAMDWELGSAFAAAGGLGSLPCVMISADTAREHVRKFRERTDKPFNLGFFTHKPPVPDNAREAAWRDRLAPYYREFGLDPNMSIPSPQRAPFNDEFCDMVVEVKPKVSSFHFGMPEARLLRRVKDAGCIVICSATTVTEARDLEAKGADIIVAQGAEAGGHRGMFLTDDPFSQTGTLALVPLIVDAVKVPVLAAGGIMDGRGIAAAFALGAAGVQLGTAFLHCPESKISRPHRAALKTALPEDTTLTNVPTGRLARSIRNRIVREQGPVASEHPQFPLPANALAPLRAKGEEKGSGDFSPLWSGAATALGRAMPAGDLLRLLVQETESRLRAIGGAL
jgi:nitronate monooxygenase